MAEGGGLTIAQRMAALKLNQVGRASGDTPPYSQRMSVAPASKRPPPPPPPVGTQRPAGNGRMQTSNNPLVRSHAPVNGSTICNTPEESGTRQSVIVDNGASKPILPQRPSRSPALPPRRPSEQTPALPMCRPSEAPSASSLRPSELALSRKESNESMSSVVSSRSSVSAMSAKTSASQNERYMIRAPAYDPSFLPPLPPKRELKEPSRQPLKSTHSSPSTVRRDEPTPAQNDRLAIGPPPPALPDRPRPSPSIQSAIVGQAPAKPPRRSALSMGLNQSSNNVPPPLANNKSTPTKPTANGQQMRTLTSGLYGILYIPNSLDELNSQLASASDTCVVLYFTLPTCPPCKIWAGPKTEELAAQYAQTMFVKIDLHGPTASIARTYLDGSSYRTPTWVALAKGSKVDQWTDQMMADTGLLSSKIDDLMGKHGNISDAPINGVPPSVPRSSRPDISSIMLSKPKPTKASRGPPAMSGQTICIHCRDFSGPDNHAASFPRQTLPTQDISWLAHQLCDPFPDPTDKARALFTWQHHNIAYNVADFFAGTIKSSTPASTIATGKAVCEGYAALYAAMALTVGLEAIVISGNGKGFGHVDLGPSDPTPPLSAGHAWNAVKIDGGEWKLIDACWGAGSISGPGQPFQKRFAAERFTQNNNDFGLDHFPMDNNQQFRTDGRMLSWESYIRSPQYGNGPFVFGGYVAEEGIDKTSLSPHCARIPLSQQGPTTRFMFQKVCPHWDPQRCGKGPYLCFIIQADGLDGTTNNHMPFERTKDGVWWIDLPTRDLGKPGQSVSIFAVTSFDNSNGRGISKDQYMAKKGRCTMKFEGVSRWELVA